MPYEPKLKDFPRIRNSVKFYKVSSYVTGVMLLLLVCEMVLKYGFSREVFAFSQDGFLSLEPVTRLADGTMGSISSGVNLSILVLIVHGWLYVVYLFVDFRLWSLMRWPFWRFLLIALGGVVPFLSFIMEALTARFVYRYLTQREAAARTPEVTH
jgi:integral membrane protein